MNLSRRQQATVLFGDTLNNNVPASSVEEGDCIIPGLDTQLALTHDILSKHLMFLGGIGTGKTNAFYHIVSQLRSRLTHNDVMIVFDTKGDFYNEFYRPGDIVISNDNKAVGVNGEDYWNIFNEIAYDSRQQESVIEISKALFAEACKKTNQIFFPNAAKDIFMALLIHFIRSVPEIHRCNENLIKFINRCSATDIKAILNSCDDFKAMSSYISNEDSPQTQGVLSELQQIVREIFIGNFAKNGTLSLKNLVRNKGGKTVFIEYDLSVGNMLSPIYSLLFDLAIKEALGRNRSEGNVYFITDEFKLLPHLQHIDDAVNFGRSLGIKFMVGVQNVEQIYDNYGEERARSIMSGFSTTISFRVNDAKSREYIQSLYGKNQKLESFMPTMQSKGLIESQREANVVEDWDITRLQIGEAIIGLPGQEPFKFRFKKY
ncbi:MAG: type IV secretion system DNA-binding domain-containing protein [Clostridia bacterium]|nr:type IV secretion system DNA-binding domain-containing protein [Clostridia bacterium]